MMSFIKNKNKPHFIKQLLIAFIEYMQYIRSIRILEKQKISTDYLIYLLKKSGQKDAKITIQTEDRNMIITFENASMLPIHQKEPDFKDILNNYLGFTNE